MADFKRIALSALIAATAVVIVACSYTYWVNPNTNDLIVIVSDLYVIRTFFDHRLRLVREHA